LQLAEVLNDALRDTRAFSVPLKKNVLDYTPAGWQKYDDCCHCCHEPVIEKSDHECAYDE
jgi:hypothetical protein